MLTRNHSDSQTYQKRIQNGPCFICQIINNNPDYPHQLIFEDELVIAFLERFPTLYGHTLVAPKSHREQVTGDFCLEDYLSLQRRVHAIAEAVRYEVQAERVYVLSLGSQQGNAHVHWHIAPLPPGVPFEEQQLQALSWGNGILEVSADQMAFLAARIRLRLITQTTAAHSWHLDLAG